LARAVAEATTQLAAHPVLRVMKEPPSPTWEKRE
jgi:hypothetical protein